MLEDDTKDEDFDSKDCRFNSLEEEKLVMSMIASINPKEKHGIEN